jgi:alkaline phosphatase
MKKVSLLLLAIFAMTIMISCSDDDNNDPVVDPNSITEYNTPKYVFFFIGDGMAQVQMNLAEAALNDPGFKGNKTFGVGLGQMAMSKFPVAGMSTTHAEDRYITGSAASATALACGEKTTINTISKNGDHTQNLKTMAEMAKEKGMRVGIVSSVSIDHATPACFYAHEDTRKNMYAIAEQMTTSGFDYFGGGGAAGDKSVGDLDSKMETAGYTIAKTRAELAAIQPGTKCWAYNHNLDGSAALVYAMDRPDDDLSLAEFTQKGIELLDNENGFFLMVEGGKVDWACHANDAVAATYDMLAFDAAIQKAVDFYNQHPDETLIVITGDHECGGLTIGFSATGYATAFEILKYQTMSYDEFDDIVASWRENPDGHTFQMALDKAKEVFGLGNTALDPIFELNDYELETLQNAYQKSMGGESVYTDEETSIRYGYYDPFTVTCTHILANKAGVDWTSYSHTGVPVPVMAMGQGQYEFSGYYDNTDIAKKIMKIADYK